MLRKWYNTRKYLCKVGDCIWNKQKWKKNKKLFVIMIHITTTAYFVLRGNITVLILHNIWLEYPRQNQTWNTYWVWWQTWLILNRSWVKLKKKDKISILTFRGDNEHNISPKKKKGKVTSWQAVQVWSIWPVSVRVMPKVQWMAQTQIGFREITSKSVAQGIVNELKGCAVVFLCFSISVAKVRNKRC